MLLWRKPVEILVLKTPEVQELLNNKVLMLISPTLPTLSMTPPIPTGHSREILYHHHIGRQKREWKLEKSSCDWASFQNKISAHATFTTTSISSCSSLYLTRASGAPASTEQSNWEGAHTVLPSCARHKMHPPGVKAIPALQPLVRKFHPAPSPPPPIPVWQV